jgi:hypothetical protein
MKALILGVLAVGAFAGGVSMAADRPADHHVAAPRHRPHQVCTVRHGHRVCHMVR